MSRTIGLDPNSAPIMKPNLQPCHANFGTRVADGPFPDAHRIAANCSNAGVLDAGWFETLTHIGFSVMSLRAQNNHLPTPTSSSQYRRMQNMEGKAIRERIDHVPRLSIGLYPTPFHQLKNLSKSRNVNIFMKREDLAGPSAFSGSKIRLSEFILGQAVEEGCTHVITHGAHLTNSGLQFATAAAVAGMTPILYLTRDLAHHGPIDEYRGNLQIMDAETHFLNTSNERKAELEAEGHRAIIVPAGGAHPFAFIAHALTFLDMIEKAEEEGIQLDYIYHTAGTGTALPGLIAARLLTGYPVKVRSITVNLYKEGSFMSPFVIAERVRDVLSRLRVSPPAEDIIRAEIDVDNGFIGGDYGVPTSESIDAIRELAKSEGIFVGPVYTGKGLAGLLHHTKQGKVPAGPNVAFIHTGDTANLFEVSTVVGTVTEDAKEAEL
ncbi:hypothetical protein NM208_g1747 [Fusarium decemcellulare]|uniref:Uncharacterized protein n=1 Tax=Fusarium decemcellulare TaxID=57161 RepID=A0ACC1SUV5_9HYPO|nr:hypothetical protein NM208_g1747 [Fusarium decemcellulare]